MLADETRVLSATILGGVAIMAAWLTLMIGGRWRTEASWVDRLGRAMGIYWILTVLALLTSSTIINASGGGFRINIQNPSPPTVVGQAMLTIACRTMPVVALVTVALVPFGVLSSRGRLRRLARVPGHLASWAGTAAIMLCGLQTAVFLALWAVQGISDLSWDGFFDCLLAEDQVLTMTTWGGLAVLVSWTTVLLGRRWRPYRSWVDRFGRAVGIYWIVAALAVEIGHVLIETHYMRLFLS